MLATQKVIISHLNVEVSSPIGKYESHIHLFFIIERLFYYLLPPITFGFLYTSPEAANIFLS